MTVRPTDDQVTEVVLALPIRLRRVYVMAHVQRLPRVKIALALNISPRRVEKRLSRALERCRESMG